MSERMLIGLVADVTFEKKRYVARIAPHFQVEAKTKAELREKVMQLWWNLERLNQEYLPDEPAQSKTSQVVGA